MACIHNDTLCIGSITFFFIRFKQPKLGTFNFYGIAIASKKSSRKTCVALPLVVSFFVFIIFAANSRPVDFCTHLFTIENAPLRKKEKIQAMFSFISVWKFLKKRNNGYFVKTKIKIWFWDI